MSSETMLHMYVIPLCRQLSVQATSSQTRSGLETAEKEKDNNIKRSGLETAEKEDNNIKRSGHETAKSK